MKNLLAYTTGMPEAIVLCEKHIEILEAAGFKFKAMREGTNFDCQICFCEEKREKRR